MFSYWLNDILINSYTLTMTSDRSYIDCYVDIGDKEEIEKLKEFDFSAASGDVTVTLGTFKITHVSEVGPELRVYGEC